MSEGARLLPAGGWGLVPCRAPLGPWREPRGGAARHLKERPGRRPPSHGRQPKEEPLARLPHLKQGHEGEMARTWARGTRLARLPLRPTSRHARQAGLRRSRPTGDLRQEEVASREISPPQQEGKRHSRNYKDKVLTRLRRCIFFVSMAGRHHRYSLETLSSFGARRSSAGDGRSPGYGHQPRAQLGKLLRR